MQLIVIALVALFAYLLGSAGDTEVQAVGTVVPPAAAPALTSTDVSTALASIPQDHECVLRGADGTVQAVVADTDPQCKPEVTALSDVLAAEDRAAPAPVVTEPAAQHEAPKAKAKAKAKAPKSSTVRAEDGSRVGAGFYAKPLTSAEIDAQMVGIPTDHECVLQTADATVYGLVVDSDPRCDRWWGTDGLHAPKVAPFDPRQG